MDDPPKDAQTVLRKKQGLGSGPVRIPWRKWGGGGGGEKAASALTVVPKKEKAFGYYGRGLVRKEKEGIGRLSPTLRKEEGSAFSKSSTPRKRKGTKKRGGVCLFSVG